MAAFELRKKQEESAEKDAFECDICCEDFQSQEKSKQAILLSSCEHVFHKDCMQHFFKAEIHDMKVDILCPDS